MEIPKNILLKSKGLRIISSIDSYVDIFEKNKSKTPNQIHLFKSDYDYLMQITVEANNGIRPIELTRNGIVLERHK